MDVNPIKEIAEEITKSFQDISKQANESIKVFIIGSYLDETDKGVIMELEDRLRKRGIHGAFLMEQIKVNDVLEEHLDQKFMLIWDQIKSQNPCFILYAGSSAEKSQGFLAELSMISLNPEMLDCAHLFKKRGVQLPHFEKRFINLREVDSGEEFLDMSTTLIERKVSQIQTYLLHQDSTLK